MRAQRPHSRKPTHTEETCGSVKAKQCHLAAKWSNSFRPVFLIFLLKSSLSLCMSIQISTFSFFSIEISTFPLLFF